MAVVLAGVWLVGGFWTSVQLRSPRAAYPSALAGQGWARSPEPGERAFFRLSFPVTTLPLTATLWVDADQAVTPYLNGFRVAAPPELPPYAAQANLAPAATGQAVPEQVDTFDLLPALGRGMNTVGLEVVNLANRPPSFQARVELNFGAGTVVMGTRPGDWLSTTNVALTARPSPSQGRSASLMSAPPGGWGRRARRRGRTVGWSGRPGMPIPPLRRATCWPATWPPACSRRRRWSGCPRAAARPGSGWRPPARTTCP